MKIRGGFVSNSSAASFVIRWRPVDFIEDVLMEEELRIRVDNLFYNEEIRKYLKDNTECNERDHYYVTSFDTSLYNDATDLEFAALFRFALLYSEYDKFMIVREELISDNN